MPVSDHRAHKSNLAELALEDVSSPFEVMGRRTISPAPAALLRALGYEVFSHGLYLLPPALVLMLVPHSGFLSAKIPPHLEQMARRGIITGVVGAGVPADLPPGVRGSSKYDPALDGQYAVVALSPSTAVAVIARQAHRTDTESEFGVIHDRQPIVCAARCLLRQLGPSFDSD